MSYVLADQNAHAHIEAPPGPTSRPNNTDYVYEYIVPENIQPSGWNQGGDDELSVKDVKFVNQLKVSMDTMG